MGSPLDMIVRAGNRDEQLQGEGHMCSHRLPT